MNRPAGSPLEFACDYAAVGCSNVGSGFRSGIGTPSTADTEVFFEFGPGAGNLALGTNSGPIDFRVFHQDFSTMTQGYDYSYNPTDTTLKPNPNIDSLIVGSELNWGVPPPSSF